MFWLIICLALDSLDGVYIADSTILCECLSIEEITTLERARLAEYKHIKRAYRHYSYPVWGAQMTLWLKHTYDSLEVAGKDPWSYYYVIRDLPWQAWRLMISGTCSKREWKKVEKEFERLYAQSGVVFYFDNMCQAPHWGVPSPGYPDE